MYVKVYMTEQEKETLSCLADKKGLALSHLIYERLLPLLHDRAEEAAAFDTLANRVTSDRATLTETLTLHLSRPEVRLLQELAKGTPLSVYVRYLLFLTQTPAVIQIDAEDIAALTLTVSAYLEQLRNFAAALYVRNELYDADRNRRQTAAYTKANRQSIRASGNRWLRRELKRILAERGYYDSHM